MRILTLGVLLAACTPQDPPCLPFLTEKDYAQWDGTLAATTISDGDLVALSCTTLTRVNAGNSVELALPARSAPFSLASSGNSNVYVANQIIAEDPGTRQLQLVSATAGAEIHWSLELGYAKDVPATWKLLAGPQGPVVAGFPEPNRISTYAASNGVLVDTWLETSTTPPVVNIDGAGDLYVATSTQPTAATLRTPRWSKTLTAAGVTIVAVQPIANHRVAVLGKFASGSLDLGDRMLGIDKPTDAEFVAVIGATGATEWGYAWPHEEATHYTIAEVGGRIVVGDVLTHYVYGPNVELQQWDVVSLDESGFLSGSSHDDATQQRWISLLPAPDGTLWSTVDSIGPTASGTSDTVWGNVQTVTATDIWLGPF